MVYAQTKTEPKLKKDSSKIIKNEKKVSEQLKEEKQEKEKPPKKAEKKAKKDYWKKKPLKLNDPKIYKKKTDRKVLKKDNAEHPLIKFKKKYKHIPYKKKIAVQQIHYPKPVNYHYTVPAMYIYRGLWIRIHFFHDNGFYFYHGYPYYVYNNVLHRYSEVDSGSFDLVDSYTDKVYATFYGQNLRQSYDRCAQMRDILNDEEGDYRYFCAERFEYDPEYQYNWVPENYPDWYWY